MAIKQSSPEQQVSSGQLKNLLRVTLILFAWLIVLNVYAEEEGSSPNTLNQAALIGAIKDAQVQPVEGVHIKIEAIDLTLSIDPVIVLGEGETQEDGSFAVGLNPDELERLEDANREIVVKLERSHFKTQEILLDDGQRQALLASAPAALSLGELVLERRVTFGFWLATAIFIMVLVFIATGWLHNTLSALLGVSLAFAVSYLLALVIPSSFVFTFPRALDYIDWNVIFLIMGMMMVIAVVEHTGIFQWLAFAAYKASRGRMTVLLIILVLIASVGSAILDNVTTMLLMTPITIRIALTMRVNPLALLMPTVFASNVAGVSTLVGTPTNILIGSFADISFNDFLINQTVGVVMALIGLVIYSLIVFRKELSVSSQASEGLLKKLEQSAQITQPENLRRSGWVGLGMLILFVLGESVHLTPSVTAIMGATALLVWIRPDIEEMIKAVDWTTLVFFMTLFIVVGAIQEVGLIAQIATLLANIVGDNLILAMIVVIWASALLSTIIANIPFTAAMLPVIAYLTSTIPGADTKVLYYCLSVGAAMGGNGSLIGASANMVTAGISERAGYPITYVYFLRKGLPALFITVGLATVWLFVRFVVLAEG